MENSLPFCSIIIVSYQGRELLKRFLPSIANLEYPSFEVIIVDNASSDGSVEFVKKQFPQFKVIENKENFGTAQGSNIGAREAKGDYIFWLSNDMELEPLMLNYMIQKAKSDEKIGICTCKMRRITEQGDKLNIIDSVGGDIDVFGFPYMRGVNQEDNGQWDNSDEVFFSFGGAMLIKREVFEKTGGYDKRTFTLGDDIDLSWRVRLLGYKVVVEPKAVLYHRVSATLGTSFGRSQKRFMSERNTLMMLIKNYSLLALLGMLSLYLLILLGEITFFLLLGKFSLVKSGIRAISWNVKHIKDTLQCRREIQKQRIISDSQIFKLMKKKSFKICIFLEFLKFYKTENWIDYFGENK
jgi:hypothetical protein